MRILLVEDDLMIARAITSALRESAYAVDWVESAGHALSAIAAHSYALVLLDLGLPDRSGLTLLKHVRHSDASPPAFIVLTASDDLDTRVQALDTGADDYMAKPFELAELKARIRAVMRRPSEALNTVLCHGDIRLDTRTCEASVGAGIVVQLSRREYALFEALMRQPGTILSLEQLENHIYGWGEEVESNAVEYLIRSVRKKLGARAIKNVRGLGWLVGDSV